MRLVDGAEKYRSTVENYRTPGNRYEREPLPYDLADPLDLGVWVGLCAYSRYIYGESEQDQRATKLTSPWELEQDLRDLCSNARAVLGHPAHERLSSREALATGLAVLGALFPAEAPKDGDGNPTASGVQVPADLWRTSSGWIEHLQEPVHWSVNEEASPGEALNGPEPEPDEPQPDEPEPDGEVDEDLESRESYEELRLSQLGRPLVTIVYMARLALGGTITQSEAARRLGVTPVRVNALVGNGRLSHVRVGRTVLLLEEEVGTGLADRRRRSP